MYEGEAVLIAKIEAVSRCLSASLNRDAANKNEGSQCSISLRQELTKLLSQH